jgi:hypothetical protein
MQLSKRNSSPMGTGRFRGGGRATGHPVPNPHSYFTLFDPPPATSPLAPPAVAFRAPLDPRLPTSPLDAPAPTEPRESRDSDAVLGPPMPATSSRRLTPVKEATWVMGWLSSKVGC